jgi:hypothetical protein
MRAQLWHMPTSVSSIPTFPVFGFQFPVPSFEPFNLDLKGHKIYSRPANHAANCLMNPEYCPLCRDARHF